MSAIETSDIVNDVAMPRKLWDIVIDNLKMVKELLPPQKATDVLEGIIALLENQLTDGKKIVEDGDDEGSYIIITTYAVPGYDTITSERRFKTRTDADAAYRELLVMNNSKGGVKREIRKVYPLND